jgi:multidrug efflux pump subunit AcrB
VVLMIFMGLRSGILIGMVLLITILGTFIIMAMNGVMLERISLGALIIALGMLVDNAIVITEGMLIRIQRGEEKVAAVKAVVGQNAIPLLGATIIAVLAFASIGTSQDSTGEFCRSLYQVILYSLILSWVTAVTTTPLFCVMAFKPVPGGSQDEDPYKGGIFKLYKTFLSFCIRRRWLTVGVMVILLILAGIGFQNVEQSFFPESTRPQFQVDFWLPEGTHILDTEQEVTKVEAYLQSLEGVTQVVSCVGQGAPRFILTFAPEKLNSSYTYFLISVDDYRKIPNLITKVQSDLEQQYPHAIPIAYKFMLGPGEATKIQARFSGPDWKVLRELADQALDLMHVDGQLIGIQTDWRDMIKDYRPILAEVQARSSGIDRPDVGVVMKEAFDGKTVGVYREGKDLIPIVSRPPAAERQNVADIKNLQIWSPVAGRNIPLQQVISGYEMVFDNSIIERRNRKRTITVRSNPREGNSSVALARIMPKIEAIDLPPGYELEWGGEYENSRDAQVALAGKIPMFVLLMILIVIFLFNNLRQPLIIWLCVPLAIIGVTAGLLLTRQPFGFMSLLGLLSLSGMLIKNAIVLIDQINLELREGKSTYQAIVDSGVSRMRPVMMAAATTVLGMVPLLFDAFFIAMAVTIMAGLAFASVLTLIVVPVLYAIFYRAKAE